MAKKPFFPDTEVEQLLWLNEFKDAVALYAEKYGISAIELTAINDDANWLGHWFGVQGGVQTYSESVTAFKNEVAFGLPEGAGASLPPELPSFGVAPTAVDPGVFPRALALAGRIKSHIAYTIADGEAMKLEGAEEQPVDVPNLKPVIKLVVAGPDLVDVNWKKNRTQGVEIWVKRGSADWQLLAFDTTTPKYVDTHAFPAVAETWEYKAIYHYAGTRAGQWSQEVSVVVKA